MTAIGAQKFGDLIIFCSDTQATTGDKVSDVRKIFFNKDTLIAVSGTLLEKKNYIDFIDQVSKEGMSQDLWCAHLERWNNYFKDEDFDVDMGCLVLHKGEMYKTGSSGTVWTPWDIYQPIEGMGSGDHFVESSDNVISGVAKACESLLSCGGDLNVVVYDGKKFNFARVEKNFVSNATDWCIDQCLDELYGFGAFC